MKTIIIGIAGGTGSGKTTLTEKLRDHFGANEVSVLNHDSYYKRHDELPYEERCKLNYDHPDSFDTPLMVAHLRELRAGHPVQVPVYDYTIHNRSDKTVTVQPAPVIIVEGILIFDSSELCDLMDMKVFVDTDADVRILRRIVRGPADDSYGIEVAKLAGLPGTVTRRAHEVLRALEATAPKNKVEQMDFDALQEYNSPAVPSEVLEKLDALDVETLTPIEALNFLYELKKTLKGSLNG